MIFLAALGGLTLAILLPLLALYAAFRLVAPWLPSYKAGTLSRGRKAVLVVALMLDVVVNRWPLSLLFWDRAQESTVTKRMRRYLGSTGWRFHIACIVADELNRHDPQHV